MFANQQKNINGKTYINTKMELSIDKVKCLKVLLSNTYSLHISDERLYLEFKFRK